jgi:hypothetical protein
VGVAESAYDNVGRQLDPLARERPQRREHLQTDHGGFGPVRYVELREHEAQMGLHGALGDVQFLPISRFVFPEMRDARTCSSRSVKLGSPRLMSLPRTMTSFATMAYARHQWG